MYDNDDKSAINNDNSKKENQKRNRRNESEGESIRRRKENTKKRQEKLIDTLERKKPKFQDAETNDKSDEKRIKNVFEVQEENKVLTGRPYTVSLALAGSILDNAQTAELRTYLAGQVARALSIFCIDEVIIFDDEHEQIIVEKDQSEQEEYSESKGCIQLNRILQYLECPQYLRKHFFSIHRDLQYAGVLNPTDMPHHVRANEISEYREGIVLENSERSGSLVNVGLKKNCAVDKTLTPGLRVTVHLDLLNEDKRFLRGRVVSPAKPRTDKGLYWGYSVRVAEKFSHVFTKSPYKGGYDLTVGTSERGTNVDTCTLRKEENQKFKHLLIVFGGVRGLEAALKQDQELNEIDDPSVMFDIYLNTCPKQGSRTIRTEEAILVSLAALRPKIEEVQNN